MACASRRGYGERMHSKKRLTAETLKHVIETHEFVEEMRARGHTVDVADVNVDPEATEGFPVTCVDCGRTARLPFEPPEGMLALCPNCMRARRG